MDVNNRLVLKVGLQFNESEAWVNLNKQLNALEGKLKNFNGEVKKVPKVMNDTTSSINNTNKSLKGFSGFISEVGARMKKNLVGFTAFTVVSGIFLTLVTQIKRAFELMIQLDTAFTNFQIVTKATDTQIEQVDARISQLTTSLGRLKTEVINSATEFARAGFSIEESLTLAEKAIKGANVGMVDLADVTTFVIAGLKSFNLEATDSTRILDVLFTVANKTAIDLDGIGEAFLRSANTLQVAGATLEQSASLIAAANESIQDPAKVGTALKTIASRLRGVSDEGEIIPSLAKDFKQIGIEIQNADGSFRNIYDIFKEFADVYGTLDDLTRESLLEKVAGKRQKNILIGLLSNFDTAQMALQEAMNSAGEVAIANEKYIDSLAGRINILSETWNSFSQGFINSEFVKGSITFLTGFINVLDIIINKMPILGAAVAGAFAIINVALLSNPITALPTVIAGVASAILGVKQATDLFQTDLERTENNISKINSSISELNSKINEITSIENRTQAQQDYLDALENELSLKKQLLEQENNNSAIQQAEELNKIIKNLNKEINSVNATLSVRGLLSAKEQVVETESAINSQIASLEELSNTLDKNSDEYHIVRKAISDARVGLDSFNQSMVNLGAIEQKNPITEIANSADDTKKSVDRLQFALDTANDLLLSSSSNYQLVSDALIEMTKNGYLSDEMITSLTESYPELITETGLVKDAFIDMANGILKENKKQADSSLELLEFEAKVLEQRIALYKEGVVQAERQRKALQLEILPTSESAIKSFIEEDTTALKNLQNSISLLKNETKQFSGIDKVRTESLKETNKTLSEQERLLNDINYQVSKQEKLISRLNGQDKIDAQNELIELYKQQYSAIGKQINALELERATVKNNTSEWDDLTSNIMRYNLELEDTLNSIYNVTDAIKDQKKELLQIDIDNITDGIEKVDGAISKLISNEVKNIKKSLDELNESYDNNIDNLEKQKEVMEEYYTSEIDALKDAKDISDDYYDAQIEAVQNQIDARKEYNDELEYELELQNKLKDLAELQAERENILSNKNVRVVQNADIGYVASINTSALDDVNDKIQEAEEDLQKFREDKIESDYIKSLENQIIALQDSKSSQDRIYDEQIKSFENLSESYSKNIDYQIEKLNEQREAEVKSYELAIEGLENYQDKLNEQIEIGGAISQTLTQEITNSLTDIERIGYENRLNNLDSFISDYNSKINTLNSLKSELKYLDTVNSNTSNYSGINTGNQIDSSSNTSTSAIASKTELPSIANNTTTNSGITMNNTTIQTNNTSSLLTSIAISSRIS